MKLVFTLLRHSRPLLLGAVSVGVLAGLTATLLLALVNAAVIQDVTPDRTFFLRYFALGLLLPVATVTSAHLLQRLGQGAVLKLRLRLSREILTTPLKLLEELGAHRLLTVVTEDVSMVSMAIITIPVVAINGSIILGCLVYLAWLSPRLFFAFLALLVFGVVTYRLPLLAGVRRFQLSREIFERLYAHFRGLTDGIKELKLHGERREDFLDSLKEAADHQRRLQIQANTIFSSANAWGQLIFFMVVGGLLLARPQLAVGREVLMSYIVVMIYMMAPLQALLNALPQLSRADVSVKRIEELGLSLQPRQDADGAAARGPAGFLEAAPDWRELRLEEVTHSYRGESEHERFTLGPIDLTVRPGELVIVAGGNGSGKTTLAKLLLGLYEPESGRILLDGEPIDESRREPYRQRFSAVFADFFLFEELLGLKTDGVDERARGYLEMLQIQNKVAVEDGVLSTTSLSQGQRKRLALLTAYLEDRPIYLFDEWAADQDPIFKRIFYETLLPELKARGKTVIAISHDDQYYGVADRLVRLDYGQLVYDGPVVERPLAEAVG